MPNRCAPRALDVGSPGGAGPRTSSPLLLAHSVHVPVSIDVHVGVMHASDHQPSRITSWTSAVLRRQKTCLHCNKNGSTSQIAFRTIFAALRPFLLAAAVAQLSELIESG